MEVSDPDGVPCHFKGGVKEISHEQVGPLAF